MRIALGILAVLCAATGEASPPELAELRACVSEVREKHASLRGRIPAGIFTADRKLVNMADAIPVMAENLAYLERRTAATTDGMDGMLVANAVEGCRSFSHQFSSRAFHFQWMLVNILSLLGLLTLRALLFILPAHEAPQVPDDRSSSRRARR